MFGLYMNMILPKFKMLLTSFLLLACINFATSTKSTIFTITSTTTLERSSQESIWTFESEFIRDETALKNILTSLLRNLNETEAYENSARKMEPSKSVELSDTYISFGNISAMLTNVAYVDFSQLANSTVGITMDVEESPVQRNIRIDTTIATEKMTLFGNVILLGSNYGFTMELAKPTFLLNKLISEEGYRTTINQSEIFTFDQITTNFQPKDFKTFLIGRSGLTTSIMQRMADSWLPPIIESLNKDTLSQKIQHYEMKLRTDARTSFSRRICRWMNMQSVFSASNVPIHAEGITSMNISMDNIGSIKSCDCDFLSVKGANSIWISLVLGYQSETYVNVSLSRTEVLTTTPRTSPDYPDYGESSRYRETPAPQLTSLIRDYATTCNPLEIHTIATTIEFEIEEGTNKISKINNKFIDINKQGSLLISCPGIDMKQRMLFHSVLLEKLTEYLTKVLIK